MYLMYLKLRYNLRYKLGCNWKIDTSIENMYPKMRYKNYVPHVPQIEVQFEVQSRVHGGKINTKNLTTKVYENLKNF